MKVIHIVITCTLFSFAMLVCHLGILGPECLIQVLRDNYYDDYVLDLFELQM